MLLALLASFSILMASGSSLHADCEDISSSGNIANARHLIKTLTLHLRWQVGKSGSHPYSMIIKLSSSEPFDLQPLTLHGKSLKKMGSVGVRGKDVQASTIYRTFGVNC